MLSCIRLKGYEGRQIFCCAGENNFNGKAVIYLTIHSSPLNNYHMGFVKEFKDFAVKGNMLDLAIGVIIGGAFNNIVKSLTDDIITPLLLTPALNALNLSDLQELTMFGAVKYGMFISAVINFIIVAFVLFMLVRTINRMRKKEAEAPAAPPAPTASEKLLMEIRDELRKK